MKKNLILAVLTAVMALSASAENELVYCIVCGKEGYIDTTSPTSQGRKNWHYVKSRGGTGYVCPAAKCREQSDKWTAEDARIARETLSLTQQNIQNSKELENAVRTICQKEKYALLATKGQPDKQIEFMNKLVAFCVKRNCNAEDIWFVFAAYADIKAVKYFWPDPADEKTYQASKDQMEKNVEKKAAANRKAGAAVMGALLDTNDPQANAELMSSFFGGSKMKQSAKSGPCALALGRTKKDNSIRFVESEEFAAGIVAAALDNNREDVVSYLLKQTGGTDESFRREIANKWMTAVGKVEYTRAKIKEKIAAEEKAKKEADDKFDIPKIDKRIVSLKKTLGGIEKTVVSAETLSAVFSIMTPEEAAQYCFDAGDFVIPYDDLAEAGQGLLSIQEMGPVEVAAEGKAAYENAMKIMSGATGGGNHVALPSVRKSLDAVCANASGELGKWYKWRSELNKNWRAGVADKWIPALVSGKKTDEWIWTPGVLSETHPGKASGESPFSWYMEPGVPSAQHPGYLNCPTEDKYDLKWQWMWVPGTPDVTRLGYFAAEKEGTFFWKAGIPDPKRIGMVTGAKEGEWVLAPGFKKQADGKVSWVAGLTDPARPGIVSAEKMFCWIPDGNHLWGYSSESDETVKSIHKEHLYQLAEILGERHTPEYGGGVDTRRLEKLSHHDGQYYMSAKDYDKLFKAWNEKLDAVEEHKVLHPAVDKALSGNSRYR